MATRWGTSHFVSYEKAVAYYSGQGYSNTQTAVDRKLSDGEIHIGAPEAKPGQTVTLNREEGRYFVEEEEQQNKTAQEFGKCEKCGGKLQQHEFAIGRHAWDCKAPQPEDNAYIAMMKAQGWKVYQRRSNATYKGEYCYTTDGVNIAYVQWSDGRPSVSTVHYPNKQTGTGFHFADRITAETVSKAMSTVAPSWARLSDVSSVCKYKDWEEFHESNSFNAELMEAI